MMQYRFNAELFAKDLHLARWGRGLTTRQLGLELGISAAMISRWENAKSEPDLAKFLFICRYFTLNPLSYLELPEIRYVEQYHFLDEAPLADPLY